MLFQLLLAYCQFLLVLATLLFHLHLSSPSHNASAAAANPAVGLTTRYDADNESLGGGPAYVLGNSNHDDGGGMASHRHDDAGHAASPPTQIPVVTAAADVLLTANDLYLSNSI